MAIGASPAFADIVFSTTGSSQDGAVSGSATLKIVGGKLDIILTDTSSIHAAGNVLTGLIFTLTGGAGLTLTNVTASGIEDCTSLPCKAAVGNGNLGSQPYGWVLNGTTTKTLYAGNGSFKPGGIIDPTKVTSNANPSFTGNHNDYLVGPVTFEFSYTTAPTAVNSATFQWGTTDGDTTTGTPGVGTLSSGTVPEPTSIILLGTVFVGLTTVIRKKGQRNT